MVVFVVRIKCLSNCNQTLLYQLGVPCFNPAMSHFAPSLPSLAGPWTLICQITLLKASQSLENMHQRVKGERVTTIYIFLNLNFIQDLENFPDSNRTILSPNVARKRSGVREGGALKKSKKVKVERTLK